MNVSAPSPKAPSLLHLCLTLLAVSLSLVTATTIAQGNLSDMPSVERVKAEIKGSDETDTQARQVAVFNVLVQYVNRIHTSRSVRSPFSPDEQKFFDAYRFAAYQISQQFEKSHTAAEVQRFNGLHNRYEMDDAFERDWRTRLLGKQSAATYNAAMNDLSAGQQKHYNQEMDQYKQAVVAQQEAKNRQASGGNDPNDPTGVAIRRCLELGGSSLSCLGKGMNTGMLSLVGLGGGIDTSQMLGPGPAGVVLHGTYARPGEKTALEFSIRKVAISGCGDLDASQTTPAYAIEKRPGSVRIVVNNSPAPFTVALGPNGGLTGPGLVDVTGKTIVGWTTQTTQVYHNGVSVGAGYAAECGGSCRNTTQSPIYKVKTERCSIGSYNAPAPLPPPHDPKADAMSNSMAGMIGGLVAYTNGGAEAMDNADAPRGLRMNGLYSDGRMRLEFSPSAVILECGEAHVRLPYTVENTADRFLVRVENPSGPFTLAVESDNTLRGTGSTTVNGRLVSGMQGENVTFQQHSETCEVGTFRPKTGSTGTMKVAGGATTAPAASASVGPAAYAPSPSGASGASAAPPPPPAGNYAVSDNVSPAATTGTPVAMRVLISSAFDGGANPMAGQIIWVMRDRMDTVLRFLGAPIPANATPAQAWVAFAVACKGRDCSQALAQLKARVVTATRLDTTGKATISTPSAATGTYYLFAQVRTADGILVWDVPANLAAGDNNITLTPSNAEKLRNGTPGR